MRRKILTCLDTEHSIVSIPGLLFCFKVDGCCFKVLMLLNSILFCIALLLALLLYLASSSCCVRRARPQHDDSHSLHLPTDLSLFTPPPPPSSSSSLLQKLSRASCNPAVGRGITVRGRLRRSSDSALQDWNTVSPSLTRTTLQSFVSPRSTPWDDRSIDRSDGRKRC